VRSRTVTRLIIVVLTGIALGGSIILAVGPSRLLPPLPPPPTITAERGDMPAGIVAFEQRVQEDDRFYTVGSGFLLELPDGEVVGVTTKHSTGERPFAPTRFVVAEREEIVSTFSDLYAPVGRPFKTDWNLSVDYILMRPDAPPDSALILKPDARGAPQPGERIWLFSGRGDGGGGQYIVSGTVESVYPTSAWARMDGLFNPGGMSGSPVISQHTGQVVGMIVAASPRIGALVIGINPIGAIIEAAIQ
jgi:hypothetical protein